MRRNHNRSFYFIETVDSNGNEIIKVGSDFAPMWSTSFKTVAEALEGVKRRNTEAARFDTVKNGIIAVYEAATQEDNDGETL